MSVTGLVSIFLAAILTNNFVLSKFLGICPFLGVSKKLDTAVGMSVAVIFVMTLATLVTWPIQTFILDPNGLGYLQTIVFILIIAALVQFVEIFLKKYVPSLYSALGIYLPLITTNCAVLGVTVLNIDEGYNFVESIVNTVGAGFGFMLAMAIFAGVRGRMETSDVPKFLQGLPIVLVAASIVACSFLGFQGLVDGLFN
ncbi:electron transport complex protein RnfA [Frisingicoccus caecimuris]|jgi:electron transport complex protein RnfA|uniref:Ion-translocating oxidoreductase complex subunit A n=1 Tax=Frisingicoccus caecimuris TaxID=1796636 RepID=A0A4R2L8Z6_9FIRM|nr:electron transport complex protein RnfA [Frisingicoccus caecimuris]MCR1919352.1 electron transport complex protein RnfA [Frisingicoccus caecimuris]TCO84156.1 electron transport complex protein RnfA [Frisingicoccus caecimuris]HAP21843.1 electron transport complex protein RnfA [Lachnospiraceae bacterium]